MLLASQLPGVGSARIFDEFLLLIFPLLVHLHPNRIFIDGSLRLAAGSEGQRLLSIAIISSSVGVITKMRKSGCRCTFRGRRRRKKKIRGWSLSELHRLCPPDSPEAPKNSRNGTLISKRHGEGERALLATEGEGDPRLTNDSLHKLWESTRIGNRKIIHADEDVGILQAK